MMYLKSLGARLVAELEIGEAAAEDALDEEVGATVPDGELRETLLGLLQQLLALRPRGHAGAVEVEPVEVVERLRSHDLELPPLGAGVESVQIAVLVDHLLRHAVELGSLGVVDRLERRGDGLERRAQGLLLRRLVAGQRGAVDDLDEAHHELAEILHSPLLPLGVEAAGRALGLDLGGDTLGGGAQIGRGVRGGDEEG
jgi:hypothetical protein